MTCFNIPWSKFGRTGSGMLNVAPLLFGTAYLPESDRGRSCASAFRTGLAQATSGTRRDWWCHAPRHAPGAVPNGLSYRAAGSRPLGWLRWRCCGELEETRSDSSYALGTGITHVLDIWELSGVTSRGFQQQSWEHDGNKRWPGRIMEINGGLEGFGRLCQFFWRLPLVQIQESWPISQAPPRAPFRSCKSTRQSEWDGKDRAPGMQEAGGREQEPGVLWIRHQSLVFRRLSFAARHSVSY